MASNDSQIKAAVDLLLNSDALIFTSGAGMGVASGLGTFRGIGAGVWPPLLEHPDLDFTDMSNPSWFHLPQGNQSNHQTANFAYAFWSYRYESYTETAPHQGYQIAKRWANMNHIKSSFSFTSNIDGHWIKSGWNESDIYECHGSIDYMQCVANCSKKIWPTNGVLKLKVDPVTNCAIDPLPTCSDCQRLARPNVLMFGDWEYYGERQDQQMNRFENFKQMIRNTKPQTRLLVIELGAGTAVPTVRHQSESLFINRSWIANFIRINPSEQHVKIPKMNSINPQQKTIEICLDALTALMSIDEKLKEMLKN